MRVLLDTHALLWAVIAPVALGTAARSVISDESNQIFVSAASAWEISTKVRLGKLPQAMDFEQRFVEEVVALGFTILTLDARTCLRAGRLTGPHGDPFDRMLAAQALAEDMPMVSKDAKLDVFGIRRIW